MRWASSPIRLDQIISGNGVVRGEGLASVTPFENNLCTAEQEGKVYVYAEDRNTVVEVREADG